MGLHSIIEPAGTLTTGWNLITGNGRKMADIRNKDEASPVPGQGDGPVAGSGRHEAEVGQR